MQPDPEVRFLAGFLFGGAAGLAAARKIDATIRRLPGFEDVALTEAWLERETCAVPPRRGQRRTTGELTPTPRAA